VKRGGRRRREGKREDKGELSKRNLFKLHNCCASCSLDYLK